MLVFRKSELTFLRLMDMPALSLAIFPDFTNIPKCGCDSNSFDMAQSLGNVAANFHQRLDRKLLRTQLKVMIEFQEPDFQRRWMRRICGLNLRNGGDVREVRIAKRRNRGGRKYGFIRFKGVDDVGRLEHQLDNMIIRGLKLHVNRPKHVREPTKKGESTSDMKYKVGLVTTKIIDDELQKGKMETDHTF
ncbi:hypothetical protein JHK82_034091 [Glycine max]|nr:hypothetical protein JHK87_034020 [Glycine soja]KAG4980842.1 hypothetical protein JHK85_034800 [Glycine max]KAG5119671.1 hypothetical protein JHK82_034091 [Glycine max]KAG5140659.1 hypothetical protein JHK84_034427 [Glycine max]